MSDPKFLPKILVADGEDENLTLMEEILVANGYEVIKAKTGWEAFDIALEEQPDLILLEILMPEMDGYDACVKLKADPSTKEIPVIFVTSKTEEINETVGFESGAVDYIRKPISIPVLLARVKNHLSIRETREELLELLSKSLLGSIQVLYDILYIIDPAFHGMLPRIRHYVENIANYLNLPDSWQLELSIMLSHIGSDDIPSEILQKIKAGKLLSEAGNKMYDMHPKIAWDLISKLPDLGISIKMIGNQKLLLDKNKKIQDRPLSDVVELGRQLLRVVIDYDKLVASGITANEALASMYKKKGVYAPALLYALEAIYKNDQKRSVEKLLFDELKEGHVLIEDLYTKSGALIIKKGRKLTENTITMLRPFATTQGFKEPIIVKRNLSPLDPGQIGFLI